ncbi:MAG: hypothetical protein GWP06_15010 [Actinobacteria bacterium]|nr:hypothetical protein [Actinomycetota bacterium]
MHELFSNPLFLLFTILAAGCFIGKAKFFGVELGSSGGVLFVALALGQLNYSLPDMYRSFGFAVFVVIVGSVVAFSSAFFFKTPMLYLTGYLGRNLDIDGYARCCL